MHCPPKYSPRSQRPEPHTSTRQAGFCFTARASLLVVGRLCPPLRALARCCHLARLRRALRSPRPQGVAPNASPLRPPPKRRSARYSPGLLICMGGKSRPGCSAFSEESTSSSERARSSERVCIRPLSQLQPTSSSTAHGCSHTPTRPSHRMRSVASPLSPSRSRPRGGWMVRVSGLKVHSTARPCW
jgi:hypothetical protein